MRFIVERNPFEGAPMEPFWIATVRFLVKAAVCGAIIAALIFALEKT